METAGGGQAGRITRRGALGGALAVGAGAALGQAPAEAARRRRRRRLTRLRADVVIVGGGLSGMSAARRLGRAGRSVVVLEARDRLGGRTLAEPVGDGKHVDGGGQWNGPHSRRVFELAREYGIEVFETYNEGENVYVAGDRRERYPSSGLLAVPPEPLGIEALAAVHAMDEMAAEVPPDAPWEAHHAWDWDSVTVESWLRDNIHSETGRRIFRMTVAALRAASARDTSLLSWLYYCAASSDEGGPPGSMSYLLALRGGELQYRLDGGMQQLSELFAREIGRRRVLLRWPVRRIEQRASRVTVSGERGSVTARLAIVAMSPAMTAGIVHDPPLPSLRAQLLQRYPLGSEIKFNVVYDRPFWREQGLTGQVLSDREPVTVTIDNSPPDGSPGVIAGFISPPYARFWSGRPADERRAAVLGNLAHFFGPQAAEPREYIEADWMADPWSRGCHCGFGPPGVLTDYGFDLRRPTGRVHWAGSETAGRFGGFLEGAIRAGERAADEALAEL